MALGVDWSVSRRGRSFSCLRRPETPSARVTCRAVAKKPQNSWMLRNQVAKNSNWGESESGEKYEAGGGEPPPRQFGSWALSLPEHISRSPETSFFCSDLNVGMQYGRFCSDFIGLGCKYFALQILCRLLFVVRKTDFAAVKMVFDDHH